MIRFSCSCGRMLQAKETMIGQKALCPLCHTEQEIPAEDQGVLQSALPAPETEPAPAPRSRWNEDRPGRQHDPTEDLTRRIRSRRRKPEAPAPPMSGKAVFGLLLGIFSFLFLFLTGIPAMILGYLAMRDVTRSAGKKGGWGLGLSALILGSVCTFLVSPCIGFGVVWPIWSFVSEQTVRSTTRNDLQQIGMAMNAFHNTNNRFPGAAIRDPKGQPLLSWRVELLPYLGENALHQQFHLNEPWDSDHNKTLIPKMPKCYAHPLDQTSNRAGLTHYQVCVGRGTAFENPRGHRLTEITDGTSNTAMVLEASTPVEWTRPDDLPFDPNGPLPILGGLFKDGFQVLMCDGSVRFLQNSLDKQTRRLMIQRNDGMPIWLP